MASLIRRFNRVVGADALIRSTWPEGVSRPSILSNRIARLRTRVSWLGLDIAGSSATGFVLLPGASGEPSPDVVGFEAELQRRGPRGWLRVDQIG